MAPEKGPALRHSFSPSEEGYKKGDRRDDTWDIQTDVYHGR